jgi:dynein heavy chain
LKNNNWPDSIKKDFTGQLHKFMASLTETTNQAQGKTVLYVPSESITHYEEAAKDKDLVQRLESTAIHWTRQIKEVVNNQDNAAQSNETSGPLEEIKFWGDRVDDLTGISTQLNQQGVKSIVAVLEVTKSSYLEPFHVLSRSIQQGLMEADDNLKFLNTLQKPCDQITQAEPKDIPGILPNLLNCVRMVWSNSQFYNTEERLTGLMRKVSNEIINRCCAKISLREIFDGDVHASMVSLDESIQCGVLWKKIYRDTARAIQSYDPQNCWKFEDSSIFAQIDAFVQRCRDLLEICEGQLQFSRRANTDGGLGEGEFPVFGGTRGPEVTKALIGIEDAFAQHISRLRGLNYEILDVNVGKWHNDYNHFKKGVKDLEVLMQNVMNTAFEGASKICDCVALLESFYNLAKRDQIKRCVEKKTSDVYQLFMDECTAIRADFDKLRLEPPLAQNEPQFAGAALWARGLVLQTEKDWECLAAARASYLMRCREDEDAENTYVALVAVLHDYQKQRYQAWNQQLDGLDAGNLVQRLEIPLMKRGHDDDANKPIVIKKNAKGQLMGNFDSALLALFNEVAYWEKMPGDFPIPYIALDICNQKDKLRVLREHVMLVVRDYNHILSELSTEERRLFSDHIRRMDKRINQGVTKLTWASKGIKEWYVRDCLKACEDTSAIVQEFKAGKENIARNCRLIAQTLLIKIEKNYVYEEGVFEHKQAAFRDVVKTKLKAAYGTIKNTLLEMYEHFKDNMSEVQREWKSFVAQTDKQVEACLRTTVKKSLQELSRAINGDAKTEPQPLFQIHAVLESNRVEYRPNMISLTQAVNIVSKEVITTIAVVPRLKGELISDSHGGDAGSFYDVISNDDDTLKILVQIMNGMSSSATELQKYLSQWDTHKPIWEMDKDAFIRRYAKADRPLVQFDIDITIKKENQAEIQNAEMSHTINFIKIDCTLLKQSLVQHCQQWQGKLTGLLNQNAAKELKGLHQTFSSTTEKLQVGPQDLNHLNASLHLLHQHQDGVGSIEVRFEPLEAMYHVLQKFDVAVTEEEVTMLATMRTAFDEYKDMLVAAEKMLARSKVNMKRDLENALDSFTAYVQDLRSSAQAALPYSSENTIDEAVAVIEDYKAKAASARAREIELKPGLEIFNMKAPDPKEVRDTEKELDLASQIWGCAKDWEETWLVWKDGKFANLDVEVMETTAAGFNKKIAKLGRDIKSWGIWSAMKEKVDQFRQTMPLIQDLKNPTMRGRHWESLQQEINKRFDATSADFTLERVFSLGLHAHGEFIGELSANAYKEYAIETALEGIEERWNGIDVDIVEYKTVYFKVRSTEDLFTSLEDDQVSLSTMKASKFYQSFKVKINHWEDSLSHISEVLEVLLTVQRQWMYLESIFMASEDIQKQLPEETALFNETNRTYKQLLGSMFKSPNAMRCCCQDGVLETVNKMDSNLEKIQKSLDQYLETKRIVFPRFYFLSNDDLLEILGQQKDPEQVQKHLKKCFEGITLMELIKPSRGSPNKTIECIGLWAPDKEHVPLNSNVIIDGPVELWLVELEKAMIVTLQKLLPASVQQYKGKKEKWIKDVAGQLLITTGQLVWTMDCTKALDAVSKGTKNALKQAKKKQVSYLNRLSDMVRGQLTKIERSKLVSLITMEIHSRDVMEKMIKAGCANLTDFDWLAQLRMFIEKDDGPFGICWVKQTNCILEYSYEYQGNNGRLVVTPLTDRCVLTLNTAMFLNRGGNPLGPAGTGKTETVKDLGKALAKYVVVFNCSDGLDYKSVGRMFCGLVQSGGWGCFDEFNRIEIEVLSVVAMQVLTIVQAIQERRAGVEGSEYFEFLGQVIKCNPNCGIFITMNPGYAGRTELPDNLKALMRPVAMMQPDLALIAEVMLAAEGFRDGKVLAKKTITLYGLMIQQLSKQDHYDYGLRNLKAVLNCAGALKRADPDMNEEAILMRALRDMNVPKFIADDLRLFKMLLQDLFPSLELPMSDAGNLTIALHREFKRAGYQLEPFLLDKAVQLYDSKATRHCNMLVGHTLGGKTAVWENLAKAKTAMAKEDQIEDCIPVAYYILNAKSVTLNELYGAYDLATFEWADGVLSTLFKQLAESAKQEEKWLMFDGPVDTLWIESMNSVMDDNKVLTLINGDRITMSNTMSLMFEVLDLSQASPATVSRAGMIYVDAELLGWRPIVKSWVEKTWVLKDGSPDVECQTFYHGLFEKYIPKVLDFKLYKCTEKVPIVEVNALQSLVTLFDAFNTAANGLDREAEAEGYWAYAEKWFVFCMIWSVCAAVDEAGRILLDACLRDIEAQFPPLHTVYDYCIDVKKRDWEPWEAKVPNWRPGKDVPFYKLIVPTVDTTRNAFIINTLVTAQKHTLILGDTGTGKTVAAVKELEGLPHTNSQLTINFSAATTSIATQLIVESAMEKRSKDKFGPSGGKQLVLFVDDFNMPKKDNFDSQPPLEILRQWMDWGGWYDREKCVWRYILDTQMLVAMAPPSGGREVISERTQSRFNLLNFTFPSDAQVVKIFDSILTPKLVDFDDEIKPMGASLCSATLQVYHDVHDNFLPTPSKFHYLFNMREVAKIIAGLCAVRRNEIDTKDCMLRLWVHECMRVFSDRFVQDKLDDAKRFRDVLNDVLKDKLGSDYKSLMDVEFIEDPDAGPLFCNFVQEAHEEGVLPPIEEVENALKLKMTLEEKLEDYNNEPKLLAMDLVLFPDAVGHIARINRVIATPRGNIMLVGVGGSGRQSLARLAAYVADFTVFTIEITKQYRQLEFHEDLKKLYKMAGCQGKNTVFLFNDTQAKEESFVEDINNILSSGEVPNLFTKDELPEIYDELTPAAKAAGIEETPDSMWAFFIERARNYLHVVLAMSPIGDALGTRCRYYPGLVACTTIDWFHAWPANALTEVAMKFLDAVKLDSKEQQKAVASVFASVHISVANASEDMLTQQKRHNYVTPTNYLELVKGYRTVLSEKREEVGDAAKKLKNGLAKLEESQKQVEEMSKVLEVKQVTVAQSAKDCEELLVVIVSERRIADEQKKQVEADSTRIGKEAIECKAISDDAQADLDVAIPALEKAMAQVDKLDKGSISEVKAYASPPTAVLTTLEAVMILFKQKTDWASAKKKISEPSFLQQVKGYDKDNVSDSLIHKIKKYIKDPGFTPEKIAGVSAAAGALCIWVHAIYIYAGVAQEVEPKRKKLKKAETSLAVKQESLAQAKENLAVIMAKVAALKDQYDSSVGEKNRLREEAENLESKLDRADKLVQGLGGEYTRWQASIGGFEQQLVALTGDSLLAAGFLSYAGPFDTTFRDKLLTMWVSDVKSKEIPAAETFDFARFLADPTDVRDWNIQGLPKDDFSTENGVICTRSSRWPLMIDPQGQANRWVKNMEGAELKIIDLKMKDFLRDVENGIQFGMPVLLQDVLEELDPSLEPVLSKSIMKIGNRAVIKLGDKELDWSKDFRFYITTKMANPHYTPEVSTKAVVVNFNVKEEGLQAQLLGVVVNLEEPKLEEQKSELTVRVAAGKRKLKDLEDQILKLLAETEGSLLDDESVVGTLQVSKTTSEEVTAQMKIAEETEIKIDLAREGYRVAAIRATIVFFVLNDMASVDPMYQFSLDAYVELFIISIEQSRQSSVPQSEITGRNKAINTYHTLAVYTYTCRGLFERHKLMFSYLMTLRILQSENKIIAEELNFLLVGGTVLDKDKQPKNPGSDFIDELAWDNLTELEQLSVFQGLASGMDQNIREWKQWFMSSAPEDEMLPGVWNNKCNEMQTMMILRCIRPDRVLFAISKYVSNNMGPQFCDPPAFNLSAVYETSSTTMPLVFVLSPGVDPTAQVFQLASIIDRKVTNCALGQGQAPVASKMIEDGLVTGTWTFLANCHLMLSWMPELEKKVEDYCTDKNKSPHNSFRLWLSSNPHPKFPISILQRGIKMTTEPPKGLRANLGVLYNLVQDAQFLRCGQVYKYKKLLFSLAWFHAVLLERRKFKALGFNIPYEFNESDFAICHDLIIVFLDEYPEKTPFEAMRYLIAEANYGGRVTDDWDRRLVNTYIAQFFCPEALTVNNYPLSSAPEYFLPPDGNLQSYKEYVLTLPMSDPPTAFGQHSNADISSQTQDSYEMLATVTGIVSGGSSDGASEEAEARLMNLLSGLYDQVPETFNMREVHSTMSARSDPDPLKTVLFQELDRYNQLLKLLKKQLKAVQLGMKGLVVITPDLLVVSQSCQTGSVPDKWSFAYPSCKPLGSWMRDLILRVVQFQEWVGAHIPKVYWLSGFTYPTGFLTAILQTTARSEGIAIDTLSWEFPIINMKEDAIEAAPTKGALVKGMFLEGATWDYEHGCLLEPNPMELFGAMPIIHFKPSEFKKKSTKGIYNCPAYMYPIRTGTRERPSFMVAADLKSGAQDTEFWTKRGVAMLLSLAN